MTMSNRKKVRLLKSCLAAGASLVAILGASGAAGAETAGASQKLVNEFRIAEGALKPALDAYIAQSGEELVYRDDQVAGLKTKGASGSYTNEEALERLLIDTGDQKAARAEQLHTSFYNKICYLFLRAEQETLKKTTHFLIFVFELQFMLKSQQKVDIKLSKIFQAIKNLASDKRSLHASLKLFTNLHLKTPARNCQRRFKLFVDLLDSLKQGTTGN